MGVFFLNTVYKHKTQQIPWSTIIWGD